MREEADALNVRIENYDGSGPSSRVEFDVVNENVVIRVREAKGTVNTSVWRVEVLPHGQSD